MERKRNPGALPPELTRIALRSIRATDASGGECLSPVRSCTTDEMVEREAPRPVGH